MLTLLAHTVEPYGGAPGGPAGRPAHRADDGGRGVPDGAQPAPVQPGPHRPAVAGTRSQAAPSALPGRTQAYCTRVGARPPTQFVTCNTFPARTLPL